MIGEPRGDDQASPPHPRVPPPPLAHLPRPALGALPATVEGGAAVAKAAQPLEVPLAAVLPNLRNKQQIHQTPDCGGRPREGLGRGVAFGRARTASVEA